LRLVSPARTIAEPTIAEPLRSRLITIAGILIILLSAGAALLPIVSKGAGAAVVGLLLVAAGLIETFAGFLRHSVRGLAMTTGALTTFAGLLFALNRTEHFLPTVTIVTVWLLARSVLLWITSQRAEGSVRTWISISAVMDLVLGIVLLAGLSIATLIVTFFGPTPPLVASFAWVLALSFVVTGSLLLEVASCERRALRQAAQRPN
jgi:uncharacterized membrane protein HdeD (DUF308 family)